MVAYPALYTRPSQFIISYHHQDQNQAHAAPFLVSQAKSPTFLNLVFPITQPLNDCIRLVICISVILSVGCFLFHNLSIVGCWIFALAGKTHPSPLVLTFPTAYAFNYDVTLT